MQRMVLVASVLAAACGNKPSKLDDLPRAAPTSSSDPGDPWAESGGAGSPAVADDGDSPLAGFDLKGTLEKVAEAIQKPGPYEAPEHSADYAPDTKHWAIIDVGGGIVERQAYSMNPLGGGSTGQELRTLNQRLRELAKDANLAGVVMRVSDLSVSLPDVVELRAVMHELAEAGKPIHCHTEGASNATYLFLAACTKIGIAPLGDIAIAGPATMPIHVKPLMDKLGVTADFLHVGAYKGAAEPLTRNEPSKEMEETLGAILDRHHATMVEVIAQERKLDPATVKALIDEALFPSPAAKTAKLVDEVGSFEDFRAAAVGKEPWTNLELEEGAASDQMKAMMKVARFVGAMPAEKPAGKHVALVYALGDIVDGGEDGVLGARQQIASHTLVAALRAITADDSVTAVVLRIDSGGGSAQASELIWKAVGELKAKKPVVVSMSDVAASGGYYIASGATKIYALPDTLTGSIGVVGGKIAPGGALKQLGVNTFPMGRGKRATMMASLDPWTAEEKTVIQKSMEDVYDVFTGRVAAGRNLPIEKVRELAQGRVWTGEKAKELGLVDELGGLDAALAEAAKLGNVSATGELEIYPPSPTLRDVISSFGGVQASMGLTANATFAALAEVDPTLAAATEHLVRLALSFQTAHVQTVAVLPPIR